MHVSKNAWLLAAIAVPLTMFTVAVWWFWARGISSLSLGRFFFFRRREPIVDMENDVHPMQQAQGTYPDVELHQICTSRITSSMTAVSVERCTKA